MPISSLTGKGIEDAVKWFSGLSDADKNTFGREVLKMIGGTAGAGIGGVIGAGGGPAGVGVGAVAGGGGGTVAGEALGRKLSGEPVEWSDVGSAFMEGALGEGVGRSVPWVWQGAKNLIKLPFKPDAATLKIIKLADDNGIPLNIAQRSGKEPVFRIQEGIARLPFAAGTLTKAYAKQYDEWVRTMNGILDGVHAGRISEEEFGDIAENTIRTLRDRFNTEVGDATASAAASIHADPVSAEQAGRALQEGLSNNLDAVKTWANKAYGEVRGKYGHMDVDVGDLTSRLRDLSDRNVLPANMTGKVRSGVARKQSGDSSKVLNDLAQGQGASSFDSLDSEGQRRVIELAQKLGIGVDEASASLTVDQLLNLRTKLLETARGFNFTTPAVDQQSVYGILDEVNGALESGLKGTEGYDELKQLNSVYRQKMEALRPPKVAGKAGNPTAKTITTSTRPETLPQNIAQSPTAIREATTASSPSTVADIGGATGPEPIDQVRRSVFEDAATKATVSDPNTGLQRISPAAMRQRLQGIPPPLRLPSGPGTLPNVERESLLFRNPFSKAAADANPTGAMNRGFPANHPRQAETTLGLLDEAGVKPQGQRAFGDYLLDKSVTQSKELGDVRFVNPRTLENMLSPKGYGETVPAVLGGGTAGRIGDMTDLGKVITRQEVFNPSGTAKAMEALQAAGAIGSAGYQLSQGDVGGAALAAGGVMGAPWLAAKALSSPAVAKALTSPITKPTMGGVGWGAVGRGVAQAFQPPRAIAQPPTAPQADDSLFDSTIPKASSDDLFDSVVQQ